MSFFLCLEDLFIILQLIIFFNIFQQYDLYYDGNSGTYYRLNQKNEFIFHSQVHGAPVDTKKKVKKQV